MTYRLRREELDRLGGSHRRIVASLEPEHPDPRDEVTRAVATTSSTVEPPKHSISLLF
jgi:hypothetical protein